MRKMTSFGLRAAPMKTAEEGLERCCYDLRLSFGGCTCSVTDRQHEAAGCVILQREANSRFVRGCGDEVCSVVVIRRSCTGPVQPA